jgi:ribosome-binding protein aMBF1 (putative translation factor)
MNAVSEISQQEIGRRVTQVREVAGIKQTELARKITWSPAVLSRVESGERPLAAEELKCPRENARRERKN